MTFKHTVHAVLVSIVWLVPASAGAQSASTGSIAGVVRDATGAVLPGVTVEAASPALIEKTRTAVTDDQGNYKIVQLRPGTYTVTFSLSGFSTFKREGIELTTGFTAAANAEMKVGALEETVTVTGASPIVDVQNVRTQKVLARETIDALPTGRTLPGYAAVTLGVTVAGSLQDVGGNKGEFFGTAGIHGIRDSEMKMLQEGMPFNATESSNSRHFYANQGFAQEITMSLGANSAESETGGIQLNVVPKDGGNTFSVLANGAFTNKDLQGSNLDDALRARQLTAATEVKIVYDWGVGVGGPIKRDTLWFYTTHRWWGNQETAPGNYFNKTQHTLFYTPDLDRPAYTDFYQQDHGVRLTWQASTRNKFTFQHNAQWNCQCHFFIDDGTSRPEATSRFLYTNNFLSQVTWTRPVTSKLLFEAGWSYVNDLSDAQPLPGVLPTDISVMDLSTGYTYGSHSRGLFSGGYQTGGQGSPNPQQNERFAVSYVSGSHAFKTGISTLTGRKDLNNAYVNQDISYGFRGGVPVQLTQWASPLSFKTRIRMNLGLFAQDQWTMNRLTLNLGVRFDHFNAYNPAQTRPAGQFVREFRFDPVYDVPNWSDVSPRLGAAYDLFGNSKTAVKFSVGRYVNGLGAQIASATNPANAVVASTTRTWTDANGDFRPDCDLQNGLANGECGAFNNNRFGTVFVNTRYSSDYTDGFGVRAYNWQTSASVTHELRTGLGVNVSYYRNWYANFTATDNLLIGPADHDPFCIVAPVDARLPGGGGNQLCGLYDVTPEKFGQVDNLVRRAEDFGTQVERFNAIESSVNARFGKGGQLFGGVSVGRTVTDNCFTVDSPQQERPGFCHITPPWSSGTQFKISGIYPLPWSLQASATFQNLPGQPILANYLAGNAQIAPSLGRNLSAGAAALVTIPLIPNNTMFEDRLTQVDLRLTKILKVGRTRVQAKFDAYNAFNANTVLAANTRYGPLWLQPTRILAARLFKFGAQVDF